MKKPACREIWGILRRQVIIFPAGTDERNFPVPALEPKKMPANAVYPRFCPESGLCYDTFNTELSLHY
jgi:hypothetical protein